MADLPMEILFHHIFLKLPVKSILSCKCVSKAWNRLLCSPEFVRTHLNQRHEKLVITTSTILGQDHRDFFSADYEASEGTGGADAVKLNLNFPAEVCYTKILGSSNGLLCVAVMYPKWRYSRHNKYEDILIWNPSTGDSKLVPSAYPPLHIYLSDFVGFGYDSSINDGKIVRVGHPITSLVDIYSMKSNSWKILKQGDASFSSVGVRHHGRGCAVNGSIYWLLDLNPRVLERENYAQIIAFNIKESKFRKLQLPRDFEPCYNMHLKVLGGTLGIFWFSSTDGLVVWTMKEDEKEEWIKLMDINVFSLNFRVTQFIRLVGLMRNGKILLVLHEQSLSSETEKKFVLYDPRRNKKEDFSIRGINGRSTFYKAVTYVESLVSPNSIVQGA